MLMNIKKFINACVLTVLFLFLSDYVFSEPVEKEENVIKIVVDNIPSDTNTNLMVTGGFSAWIEANNKILLFDTGGDYISLLDNIEMLNLDPEKLDAVFISHNHWDHAYGLPGIMTATGCKPDVYVAENSHKGIIEQFPRARVIPVDTQTQISPGMWSTGQMKAEILNTVIDEQSLIIEREDRIYIITGCAHPGIVEIAEKAKSMFPDKTIALLAGGFHLRAHSEKQIEEISSRLREIGVKAVAPSHCTGQSAIDYFKKEWGDNYISLNLGDEYRF